MNIKIHCFVALNLVCACSLVVATVSCKATALTGQERQECFDVWSGQERGVFTERAARAMVADYFKARAGESFPDGLFTPRRKDFESWIGDVFLLMLNKANVISLAREDAVVDDVRNIVKASQNDLKKIVQRRNKKLSPTEVHRQEVKRLVAWIRLLPEWQTYEERKSGGCRQSDSGQQGDFDVWYDQGRGVFTPQEARAMVTRYLKVKAGESFSFSRQKDLEDFMRDSLLVMLAGAKIILLGNPDSEDDVKAVVKLSREKLKETSYEVEAHNRFDARRRQEVKRLVAWIRLLPEWQAYEDKMSKICGCSK